VADEPHPLREETFALLGEHVVHPEVVLGDVEVGRCGDLDDLLLDFRGDAAREAPRQTDLGPLPAAVSLALGEALLERRQREVEERCEGYLPQKEVLGEVRRGIETRKKRIDGEERTDVEIGRAAKLSPHLVHVAVELLEDRLEANEALLQGLAIGDELLLGERHEVSVLLAPLRAHLREPALDASPLRLSVFLEERGLRRIHLPGRVHAGSWGVPSAAAVPRDHARSPGYNHQEREQDRDASSCFTHALTPPSTVVS
jgi:hypothetical protein